MNNVPPSNGAPALVARKLSRTMGAHLVLRQLDLIVPAAEVVAVTGLNGAGKSTLLRCLAGQLRPSSGVVEWLGDSPSRRPDLRRRIGFAGHDSCLYPELSAAENLLFAARMHGVLQPALRVNELIVHVGLDARAGQAAAKMSQGWKQRLAIARAIVHDPPILVLDEPFAGLDFEGRKWLEQSLDVLRQRGKAICLTSHDTDQCHRIAERVFELRKGTLFPITKKIARSIAA